MNELILLLGYRILTSNESPDPFFYLYLFAAVDVLFFFYFVCVSIGVTVDDLYPNYPNEKKKN